MPTFRYSSDDRDSGWARQESMAERLRRQLNAVEEDVPEPDAPEPVDPEPPLEDLVGQPEDPSITPYEASCSCESCRASRLANNTSSGVSSSSSSAVPVENSAEEDFGLMPPLSSYRIKEQQEETMTKATTEKKTYKCLCCKKKFNYTSLIKWAERDTGRKMYACKKCYSENYCDCNHCGYIVNKKKTKKFQKRDYCLTCYKKYFVECHGCGNTIQKRNVKSPDNKDYCQSCFNERFRSCRNCHQNFFIKDTEEDEDTGNIFCKHCFETRPVVRNYTFSPNLKFMKLGHENDLFLGVELEVEPNNGDDTGYWEQTGKSIKKYLKKEGISDKFYLKWDSSVRGFELVSHPFTLEYAHKNLKFGEIFKHLKKIGCTSFSGGRCGLHVHLSQEFLSKFDIEKMRIFFIANKDRLIKFSKREGANEHYCAPEQVNFKDILYGHKVGDRRTAIFANESKGTLEVRIFRGTLFYPRFLASIQFCDAIAHYVKLCGILSLTKATSWDSFLDWCRKSHNYCHFIKYIEKYLNDKTVRKER